MTNITLLVFASYEYAHKHLVISRLTIVSTEKQHKIQILLLKSILAHHLHR